MELVGRPVVARQEEEAETDLGHEQRLGEREQMREQSARLSVTVVRPRAGRRRAEGRGDDRKGDGMVDAEHRRRSLAAWFAGALLVLGLARIGRRRRRRALVGRRVRLRNLRRLRRVALVRRRIRSTWLVWTNHHGVLYRKPGPANPLV